MPEFKDFEDEFRDFSLLVTNQLLLGIFMLDLPILSYKILVGTEENEKHDQPLILEYKWLGGIKTDMGDTRRLFFLYSHLKIEGEDFKLIFFLNHSKMGIFNEVEEPIAVKEFLFRPTDKLGEAIVNETLKWVREVMVNVMSGSN